MQKTVRILIIGFLFFIPALFYADQIRTPVFFQDNSEARREKFSWITARRRDVLSTPDELFAPHSLESPVRISSTEQNDCFYMIFNNENRGKFPLYSAGTYIIRRRKVDGGFDQIKVFLNNNPGSYARIVPFFPGEREDQGKPSAAQSLEAPFCKIQLYLFNVKIYDDVTLALRFTDALKLSFDEVMDRSSSVINWQLVFNRPDESATKSVLTMIGKIRTALPGLRDLDDGVMDSSGRFVTIEELKAQDPGGFNCSGFAKWIVDGLYYPIAGEYLDIKALKEKRSQERGNSWSQRYEDERDPYFGLDWSRNLALAIQKAVYPGYAVDRADVDVKACPYVKYIKNVGFPANSLELVLYLQTAEQPGYFYLGSVNKEFGHDPVLRQHVHVATFFPYFDQQGVFQVAVFERNRETDINSFMKRYPSEFVHLVKVEASLNFVLPKIE